MTTGRGTVRTSRDLLVVVRTMTTLDRLRDILTLTSGDKRIQTHFTHDDQYRSPLAAGLEEGLAELGAPMLPWPAATRRNFDLALAASENDRLADLHAPILLVPHGAGQQKFYPGTTIVSGLHQGGLLNAGQVVPTAIGLPHTTHLDGLAAVSPAAAARGVVVGDPALARLRGSLFRSQQLRRAFGAEGKRLVLLASTFGPDSALGHLPDLPESLAAALPLDEYQVVVALHPGIWAAHGPWQVRAWLKQAAVQVLAPHDNWQAALLAASVVISDHGSLALYAAALDKPLLLAGRDSAVTVPGSAAALLATATPAWNPDRAPREQLDAAIAQHVSGLHEPVTKLLTTPDPHGEECAHRLRELIYELLDLDAPGTPASFSAVTAHERPNQTVPAAVAGATLLPDGVRIERYADSGRGESHQELEYRHVVADLRTAGLAQLSAASVLVSAGAGGPGAGSTGRAAELAEWPQASLVATAGDALSCGIWTRDQAISLRASEPLEPLALASLAYVRLATIGHIPAEDRLYLGERAIRVVAAAG